MRDALALRGALMLLVVFGLALALLWAVVESDVGALLVPEPEGVAEQALRAVKAHRYEAVPSQLAEGLRAQVREDDLRAIGEAIGERLGGIEAVHGEDAQEQADSATATVAVKLGDGQERRLRFPLVKEHGLRRIASLDPLRELR